MDRHQAPLDLVLRTKLYRPRLVSGLVERRRLLHLLDQGAAVPVTLVSAPAGYGKSVVVSQWAEHSRTPVGWVSLDADDSSLRAFLVYLLAAVRTIEPEACESIHALLAAPQLPSPEHLSDRLVNELDALERPCVLVLDDYHRIDTRSPVHELIARLLEHPPRDVHLVIVSRRDPPLPLAHLRGRGKVREIRQRELRLTLDESAELVAAVSGLSIDSARLAEVDRELEGWAVGLHLFSLALERIADPAVLQQNIRGGLFAAEEYLLQEVVESLPPALRERLLSASILDRFCAGLLDAVCAFRDQAPGDPESGDLLELLRRRNLFTLSLDARRGWFRYHHLFQRLLYQELLRQKGPERVARLHLRASDWLADRGHAEEALRHALEAGAPERAGEIVARYVLPLVGQGKWYVLEKWLASLPEPVIRDHPMLLVARTFCHYYHIETAAIPGVLDRIDELLSDSPDRRLSAETSTFRGFVALLQGDSVAALGHLDGVRDVLPEESPTLALADLLFALSCQMAGRSEEARRDAQAILSDSSPMSPMREADLLQSLVFMSYIDADLAGTGPWIQGARKVCDEAGLENLAAWNDYLEGLFELQQGAWDEAVAFLSATGERRYFHHVRGATDGMAALAVAYEMSGRADAAAGTLESLADFVRDREVSMEPVVESVTARLALMQGRVGDAEAWLVRSRSEPPGALLFWFESPVVSRCKVAVRVGSKRQLAELEAETRRLLDLAEEQHNSCHRIELLVLEALRLDRLGDRDRSHSRLEQALRLARPARFVFPFLEHGPSVRDLLDRYDAGAETESLVAQLVARGAGDRATSGSGASPVRSVESMAVASLTNREHDVLELLAERLQDKEIAARLGISAHTVGDHLKHIYQKLGVHSRRQAVRLSAETGLFDAAKPSSRG